MTPIVGIEYITSKIFIAPNPSNDYIFIDGLENELIQVLDVNGSFVCSFFTSESPYKLSISNLVDGTYFLTDKKNQLLGKFIKGGR